MLNFKIEGTLSNDNELKINISHNVKNSKNPTMDMTLAITHAISELCARSYEEDNYDGYAYLMSLIAMTLGNVIDRRIEGKMTDKQVREAIVRAEQDAQELNDNL